MIKNIYLQRVHNRFLSAYTFSSFIKTPEGGFNIIPVHALSMLYLCFIHTASILYD